MLPIYTITTTPGEIKRLSKAINFNNYNISYQAHPKQELPIIIKNNGQIISKTSRWGINEISIISTERILTQKPYNILIRKNRCAIPCNCFFVMKKEKPQLVRLLNNRLFYLGGLYRKNEFIVLKTESPDVLRFSEYIPTIIPKHSLESWLFTEDLQQVMKIIDNSGNQWFDYYQVSHKIMETRTNQKCICSVLLSV